MIINYIPVKIAPEPTLANRIDIGTVFTGELWEYHTALIPSSVFLKIRSHVVDLNTNMLYGAGETSTIRIYGYKSFLGSTLEVKD